MNDATAMMEIEPSEVEAQNVETNAIEQVTRGEVDMQVSTAKRFPRSITSFRRAALSLATKDPKIAGSCFFVLPRAGKNIEGPSIRLAEIVAGAWGNLRCETRVVGIGDKTVTSQATCWDMERNVLIRCEASRRITDRTGRRYSDDMIVVTGNAAASIALRNAVFRVVPMAYVNELTMQCKRVAATSEGGLDATRQKWLAYFDRRGVSGDRVLAMLGRKGVEDIELDDITLLQGLHTALSDGETTLEEVFPAELADGKHKFGFGRKTNGAPNGEANGTADATKQETNGAD